MKKQKLVLLSILLAMTNIAMAKTTVTPYTEVESNSYDNISTQKQDDVTVGVVLTQTLTDKASFSLEARTYDYDYIGDSGDSGDLTKATSKNRLIAYLNNEIFRTKKGAVGNLMLGIQQDDSTVSTSKAISYRVRPLLTYPITKNFAITGDWLFTKDKTDKTSATGDYYQTHELITGVKYTGIKNLALQAQYYNYLKDDLDNKSTTDYKEKENQLRFIATTKLAGITITPWTRIDIGDYKYTDKDGNNVSSKEFSRNRYGIDLSKTVNNVTYGTSLYIQPTKYKSDSTKDETLKYAKLFATYSF